MKAFWINATERTITEVEYAGLADMQRLVGGHIEAAMQWPSGDVLYVDEEGLLKKSPKAYFRLAPVSHPLCGNGVVVGREVGDTADTYPPAMTIEALHKAIRFMSDQEVKSWAAANASDPAATIYAAGARPQVVMRTGEMFGAAPPKLPHK